MRRYLIILFLFAYLFSSTELHQLLRLPYLVSHFIEHSNINSSLNFSEFIHQHYAEEHKKDQDKKDEQLPFKSHKDCIVLSDINTPPQNLFTLIEHAFKHKKEYFIEYKIEFNSADKSSIWQPPKLA